VSPGGYLLLTALTILSATFWALAAGVGFTYLTRAAITGRRWPPREPTAGAGVRASGLGAAIKELGLLLLTLALWPVGLLPWRLGRRHGEGTPVLVIPGVGLTWAAALPWTIFLHGRRPNPVAPMSYPLLAPPARAAVRIAERVRLLAGTADDGRVDVVAMGEAGLGLRLALAQDPALPVGTAITVGAPTRAPRMGVFLPGGMARYGATPEELEGLPGLDLVVRSVGDAVVLPDESHPGDGGEVCSWQAEGHLGTWYAARTWAAALAALDGGAVTADEAEEAGA
jgi:hypothetical protein